MLRGVSDILTVFLRFEKINIFHMGQSTQEWTKKNLQKTAFKKIEGIWPA